MRLSPDNGLYCYTAAKIEEEKGNKKEADNLISKAWDLGYAGNGREASSKNANSNSTSPTKNNTTNNNTKNSIKPPVSAKKPPTGYTLIDWQGTMCFIMTNQFTRIIGGATC